MLPWLWDGGTISLNTFVALNAIEWSAEQLGPRIGGPYQRAAATACYKYCTMNLSSLMLEPVYTVGNLMQKTSLAIWSRSALLQEHVLGFQRPIRPLPELRVAGPHPQEASGCDCQGKRGGLDDQGGSPWGACLYGSGDSWATRGALGAGGQCREWHAAGCAGWGAASRILYHLEGFPASDLCLVDGGAVVQDR